MRKLAVLMTLFFCLGVLGCNSPADAPSPDDNPASSTTMDDEATTDFDESDTDDAEDN